MLQFPIVDIETLRRGSAVQRREAVITLGRACRETGFFCVSGHGISRASKAALFRSARQFFDLPLDRKQELSIALSPHNRGYVGMAAERLNAADPPDRKEAFNIGLEMEANHRDIVEQRPLRGINFWPDLPGWRDAMLAYYNQCLDVGRVLHRGFSLDLGVEERFFDPKIEAPAAVLRLLHYPARAEPRAPTEHHPYKQQPGAGEHTDYGNMTLLATDGVAGLEVRQLDGTWVEVADTGDLLLCNIGDCLMRWTNDGYRSTPHRVRIPDAERYSIAFFLDPNPDAIVEPILGSPSDAPRYPPITVREYLLGRLNATYEHRQSTHRQS
jgi:isopenicillin N synthase-like dioxygenase